MEQQAIARQTQNGAGTPHAALAPEECQTLTEFELKQFEWLKKENESDVAETRILERTALLATGALWVWLSDPEHNRDVNAHFYLIPPLFAVLGGCRCLAIILFLRKRAHYLQLLEAYAPKAHPKLVGWETYLENREKDQNNRWSLFGLASSFGLLATAILFWGLLLGVTLAVASIHHAWP
ncbi:hypothetical protein [Hymenobacter sp. BT491]|uniref:hypothetical protein n=1 Tax=Hymenobacter sp. BT491 TaxID=2766779 RepID=UPI0016539C44|nr:hypothetical protein [Hymenobacter sp. BT491]MBC6992331.1 hypothetical protein [Hymenobacter sp. BT491]